ncbi:hypothetical protein RDI58_021579 [Solanum bulbocastanum]|uniref:Uncharacterized protein n=1 Tax=Solanum bulbocastanum TaxID=147425 RepID=A0AAN8Y4I2_SOLBU
MHAFSFGSEFVCSWDADSDWLSCSPSFEPLTTDENSSNLNDDAPPGSIVAPKASTLGLFARTTYVPSPAFIMLPLFLGGALTEWMGALLR